MTAFRQHLETLGAALVLFCSIAGIVAASAYRLDSRLVLLELSVQNLTKSLNGIEKQFKEDRQREAELNVTKQIINDHEIRLKKLED
jgi:hypothetical protein